MRTIFLSFLACMLLVGNVSAQEAPEESETGLKIPRMVSLRSNRINARSGPGARYPIEWVYMQKSAPIEIIAEFEFWRKIKDWQGSETWVHKDMLSGKRTIKVINPGENNIYAKPDYQSKVIAKAEDEVIGEVEKCPKATDFCLINFERVKGWIPRANIFGIYKDEVID